jgi:hypothetical protein
MKLEPTNDKGKEEGDQVVPFYTSAFIQLIAAAAREE